MHNYRFNRKTYNKELNYKRGENVTRGLRNPNSIQALNELKNEIALELSVFGKEPLDEQARAKLNNEINKSIVSKSRSNLIGFK